eukprot:TRINITY_DN2820_c0_g2_i7.p1 TRINITY_DN2820_c0_g2~~TRINITY_DN2820_c0_g2_i7.p1  ORF type:complete len:101 (+),score=1.47 TRINITY_DN2820_c0_g2_i7:29-304(+)
MLRRPPRSTLDRSSAASDVYKRQVHGNIKRGICVTTLWNFSSRCSKSSTFSTVVKWIFLGLLIFKSGHKDIMRYYNIFCICLLYTSDAADE